MTLFFIKTIKPDPIRGDVFVSGLFRITFWLCCAAFYIKITNLKIKDMMTRSSKRPEKDETMQYEPVLTPVIHKAIIEDVELQKLHAKKVEIYSVATPKVILKDGKAETVWIDETNHPLIGNINELIELRTQQIIDAYSNGR